MSMILDNSCFFLKQKKFLIKTKVECVLAFKFIGFKHFNEKICPVFLEDFLLLNRADGLMATLLAGFVFTSRTEPRALRWSFANVFVFWQV